MNQIVVREITKHPDKVDKILGSAFSMKILGAMISICLIVISIGLIKSDDGSIKLIVFIVSLTYIFKAFDVIDFFYQAKVMSKFTVISKNIAFAGSACLKIYLILAEYSVMYFAIANVLDLFLYSVLILYMYYKTGHHISLWRFDKAMASELVKYSWPLMISSFFIIIHLKVDQVMIEHYLDLEQVGLYSVAVKLAESWYFIPTIIVSTLFPYFVHLREENKDLYQFRLLQLYFGMFWLGVFVALLTQLFGEDFIVILFGEPYRSSFDALALNIWAGVFVAQSAARGIWDISENLQFYRIISNFIAVLVNIAGNIILIPIYGILGAAIATLITRVTNNWVAPVFIKQYRRNTISSIKAINPFYVFNYMSRK